jgi:hypothetical protein
MAICVIGSGCAPYFDSITESTGLSYAQYKSKYQNDADLVFDPKGASQISHRHSGTRDGYDQWWQLTMSKSDYETLVSSVARADHGPDIVEFSSVATPPSNWRPESKLPAWWASVGGRNPQSICWCFSAGDAERHHGYFFVYDLESQTTWCWNWNHQWSSSECTESSKD